MEVQCVVGLALGNSHNSWQLSVDRGTILDRFSLLLLLFLFLFEYPVESKEARKEKGNNFSHAEALWSDFRTFM